MPSAKRKTPKQKSGRNPDAEVIPPPRNVGGRPTVILDEEYAIRQLKAMGYMNCTLRECAGVIGVSEGTLYNFFARRPDAREAYDDAIQRGKFSLRRRQFDVAMRNGPGAATMLVWLGKNYLGQREPIENPSGLNNVDALDALYEEINAVMREAEEQRFQNATLIEDKRQK